MCIHRLRLFRIHTVIKHLEEYIRSLDFGARSPFRDTEKSVVFE